MGLSNQLYNIFLKKTSSFALTIIVSAFIFERTFDGLTQEAFDSINRGKQWKDIKHLYE